jgi:integrase
MDSRNQIKTKGHITMNKKTIALTQEQYHEIINTMKNGFTGCRPNNRIATALVIEANLGLRISDILRLKLNDIIKDGNRYRLDITEQKTSKKRTFTVPNEIYNYIKMYALENSIKPNDVIFPITERAVQKQLAVVCDYLGYSGISTHSFRKFFATQIYNNNDYNIVLVQQLLQHSTPAVSQKYIGIEPKALEQAIEKHICLI